MKSIFTFIVLQLIACAALSDLVLIYSVCDLSSDTELLATNPYQSRTSGFRDSGSFTNQYFGANDTSLSGLGMWTTNCGILEASYSAHTVAISCWSTSRVSAATNSGVAMATQALGIDLLFTNTGEGLFTIEGSATSVSNGIAVANSHLVVLIGTSQFTKAVSSPAATNFSAYGEVLDGFTQISLNATVQSVGTTSGSEIVSYAHLTIEFIEHETTSFARSNNSLELESYISVTGRTPILVSSTNLLEGLWGPISNSLTTTTTTFGFSIPYSTAEPFRVYKTITD